MKITAPRSPAAIDSGGSAANGAARKLLDLAGSNGRAEAGRGRIEIGLDLSQGQLAAMVAASRANVNRALAVLVAEGLVKHNGGRFTVVQPDRLRASALA